MDNFLDKYHMPKLNQDQISKLNKRIMTNGTETVIKSLLSKKSAESDDFSAEFYKNFKEELIPIFFKLFNKRETERTLPNSSHEATVTLIPKPQKYTTKKQNYRRTLMQKYSIKYWQTS